MALLFYVTWFEHWINNLIHKRARELKLSDKAMKLLLRQTGFEAKLKCFPTLAKVPRIQERHIKAVLHCAELRNSFVHYKFEAQNDDKEEQYKRAITAAEKTVKYLTRFERRHIYKGAKHTIRKVFFAQSATKRAIAENI